MKKKSAPGHTHHYAQGPLVRYEGASLPDGRHGMVVAYGVLEQQTGIFYLIEDETPKSDLVAKLVLDIDQSIVYCPVKFLKDRGRIVYEWR